MFTHMVHRENKGDILQIDKVAFHFGSLLKGLTYLHDNLIAHMDISLENMLYAPIPSRFYPNDPAPGTILCDFGQSMQLPSIDTMLSATKQNFRGRIKYMAPEIYSGKDYNPFKVLLGLFLYAY